jgi:hypothetical protein
VDSKSRRMFANKKHEAKIVRKIFLDLTREESGTGCPFKSEDRFSSPRAFGDEFGGALSDMVRVFGARAYE